MDVVRSWQGAAGLGSRVPPSPSAISTAFKTAVGGSSRIKKIPDAEGRRSGGVVFDPHPARLLHARSAVLLSDAGFHSSSSCSLTRPRRTFVIPFKRELSSLSADAFATERVRCSAPPIS